MVVVKVECIQVMSAHNQVDLVVVEPQIPHQEYQMVVVQLKEIRQLP
jgi:hypothetical protein|tara:strand:+ start:791 stop:931 length:141 start_codon:yes stop_codon:yes gene_type:complete